MKKIIIIFLISIGFTGCMTEQRCASKYPPQIVYEKVIQYKDSIVNVYIYDTIFIKGDTIYKNTPVYINNGLIYSNKIKSHTEFASAWAQVVNGNLLMNLIQNDTAIARLLKNNIIIKTKTIHETKTEIKKVFVSYWYDKIARVLAFLLILAVCLLFITNIVKQYVKPF